MFDIGFFEIFLIGIVALIVIGPERLPGVARTAGLWVGKMRGFVASVKTDIDQELKADELKRILKEQTDSSGVHEIIEDTKSAAEDISKQDFVLRAITDDKPAPTSDTTPDMEQVTSPSEPKK